MTGSGWGATDWRGDGERREGLPQIEDLPIADQGYDREAVQEAFDRFYRHSAQLDATLRVLESVEAFSRQARDLRADIRSLRAASWGPAPSARHVWSVGHEVWAPEEPPGALAASLPRLALWAGLIVAVGVGAALAELSTLLIVGLVLAAWALVGLIELVIASRRAGRIPAPFAPPQPHSEPIPAPVEAAAAAPSPAVLPAPDAPAAAAVDVAPQETMIAAPEHEPPPAGEGEPLPEPPVEAVAEAGPELVEAAELEPVEEVAPGASAPVALEAGPAASPEEPVALEAEPAAVPEEPVEAKRPGRFWRRRAESVEDTDEDLGAADLAAAGWQPEEPGRDPWEQGVEENGEPEPFEAAAPPARGLLRRGRR